MNVVGAGEMANAVGEEEMENVKVPREMTSDDILGDTVPLNKMESMRQFCNKVLNLNSQRPGVPPFPGSHPVSLSRDNLKRLREQYYYSTWKSDGTRYMMLITLDGCYLIDRKFNFRSVDLRFPLGYANGGASRNTHNYTLLDGEMVIDTYPITHRQERRYLVYDLIAINGKSLVDVRPVSSFPLFSGNPSLVD
ncbi:mRNA-capping enzyme-like protein isoform X2 [Tanacetum coccineum]